MKKHTFLIILTVIFGCKSNKSVTEANASENMAAATVINNHYANVLDFNTFSSRGSANYSDEKQSYSFSTDIRIKKDQIIWINIKLLGFPVAKALITPDKVSYFEKINNTYFEGDFSSLSKWLATPLDFYKIQNLLLAKPIYNLKEDTFTSLIVNKLHQLKSVKEEEVSKSFSFEANNFLLKQQELTNSNSGLNINYLSYQKVNQQFLPNALQIKTKQDNKEINISIEYKNVILNEELSYPYQIPDGYERVFIP